MIKIDVIVNDKNWKKYLKFPNKYLIKKANKLNKKIIFFKNLKLNFSVLLTSNIEIKKYNKKFRNKNKSTDVLSFPFYEVKELKKLIKKKENIYLGDVIINIKKINTSNKKEFLINFDRLWIHGFLHLLGYRHKKNKDYYSMIKMEKKYIKVMN
jgi:probable rRNA maturation factor